MKKHTQEFIENYFKDNGCTLIDIYKGARTPMNYICECGEKSHISFDNFKKGKRCKQCGLKKLANQFKREFDYVYNYFKEHNCLLISTDYKNGHTPLEYQCECGNVSKIAFEDFKIGKRCWECKSRKLGDRDRLPFEFVKEQFAKEGCELLEVDYLNAHQKLKYKCTCGNKSVITYDKFKSGQRCSTCSETKGERLIRLFFEKKGVKFKSQYIFNDLKGFSGGHLRFDFALLNDFDNPTLLIEYDGEFHFDKIYDGDNYELTVKYDEMKNEYCKKNNIPLLRIPYWEFNNIEDILEKELLKLVA